MPIANPCSAWSRRLHLTNGAHLDEGRRGMPVPVCIKTTMVSATHCVGYWQPRSISLRKVAALVARNHQRSSWKQLNLPPTRHSIISEALDVYRMSPTVPVNFTHFDIVKSHCKLSVYCITVLTFIFVHYCLNLVSWVHWITGYKTWTAEHQSDWHELYTLCTESLDNTKWASEWWHELYTYIHGTCIHVVRLKIHSEISV